MKDYLIQKLANKTAKIGIIGLGYVGLPLLLRYANCGYQVIGFDVDDSKIEKLNSGQTYIKHISAEDVKKSRKGFVATSDYSRAAEVDAWIICVPTPLDEHREPDLSFVKGTMDALCPYVHSGLIVSLESTTYPGTTDEELFPRISRTGHDVGRDVFLIFSPEREDPGNQCFTTKTIPKVVGGHTSNCLAVGVALYQHVIDRVVPVSSTKVAEMSKLLENIHRAVNIGLVNEMKIVCDRMGIDVYEVIRAASTKPFGFVPYYPGPGLGGHCIPIDPFYLTWKAREYGVNTRFIELAGEINSSMPEWVVGKISDGLNNRYKSIKGSKILVIGIAYKKNIDDMRESPSVEIMDQLRHRGAEITYHDPFVPVFPKMRDYTFDLQSVDLTNEAISNSDCVLIATNHDGINYNQIQSHASLIVDTRGQYLELTSNVLRA